MKMKPHYEIVQDRNYEDVIIVRFNSGLITAFRDQYCSNPTCECAGVSLHFNAAKESGKYTEPLFSFTLDTHTWEVSNIKLENENAGYEELIKEFVTDLDLPLKERFRTFLKKAKESREGQVLDWFDDLSIEDGSCFGYSEVYGDSDNKNLIFDYKDRQYFVDDQYCTTPDCNCNEVVLSFINIDPQREQQQAEFVLKVPLGTGDYGIEYSDVIDRNEIRQIFKRFMKHIHDLKLFKDRYKKMREYGKQRILRQSLKLKTPKVISPKVGRNDPCQCGSGKKSKKCCG